jgi:hypothetical protein
MIKDTVVRVVCESMGPHQANVLYHGEITQDGVMTLDQIFQSLMDYYRYQQVNLRLESPGGSVEAMQHILRRMQHYEEHGKSIAIRSTFMCASAAAVLLAMGQWKCRVVERSTALLFHTARVDSNMRAMTASMSGNLSQSLTGLDRDLVEMLVDRMLRMTGSHRLLKALVSDRYREVEKQAKSKVRVRSDLCGEGDPRKSDWVKVIPTVLRQEIDGNKFINTFKKYLHLRMQRDTPMDVPEAYVLCLVDSR